MESDVESCFVIYQIRLDISKMKKDMKNFKDCHTIILKVFANESIPQ